MQLHSGWRVSNTSTPPATSTGVQRYLPNDHYRTNNSKELFCGIQFIAVDHLQRAAFPRSEYPSSGHRCRCGTALPFHEADSRATPTGIAKSTEFTISIRKRFFFFSSRVLGCFIYNEPKQEYSWQHMILDTTSFQPRI